MVTVSDTCGYWQGPSSMELDAPSQPKSGLKQFTYSSLKNRGAGAGAGDGVGWIKMWYTQHITRDCYWVHLLLKVPHFPQLLQSRSDTSNVLRVPRLFPGEMPRPNKLFWSKKNPTKDSLWGRVCLQILPHLEVFETKRGTGIMGGFSFLWMLLSIFPIFSRNDCNLIIMGKCCRCLVVRWFSRHTF